MMIKVEKLTKEYFLAEKKSRKVLDELDLTVNKGEAISIAGPSGCGKSTLLNIIGTLDTPTSGTVDIDGNNLVELSENERTKFRNSKLGFVFQWHHLLPQCTVLENIMLPTLPYATKNQQNKLVKRAEELLKRLNLYEQRHQFPSQISGGESQRAAFLRALINSPDILLADEPTGSLDEKSADEMGNIIKEFNEQNNLTVVLVTHSVELAKKMDKMYQLKNGKLHL